MNFIDRAGALMWRGGGQTLLIEPWGENSLRVRATLQREILDTEHALLPQPATGSRVHIDGATATVTNGRITAVATASTGDEHVVGYPVHRCQLAFYDEQGRLLLEELDPGGSLRLDARELRPLLGGDLAITARFAADPAEKLYGMGQYQQDILDLKGCTLELAHRNSQASVPFVLSSRGYGFLWHNPAIGTATFGGDGLWGDTDLSEAKRQIDLCLDHGVNLIDTANVYSGSVSETIIGEALADGRRDRLGSTKSQQLLFCLY